MGKIELGVIEQCYLRIFLAHHLIILKFFLHFPLYLHRFKIDVKLIAPQHGLRLGGLSQWPDCLWHEVTRRLATSPPPPPFPKWDASPSQISSHPQPRPQNFSLDSTGEEGTWLSGKLEQKKKVHI